MKTLKTTTTSLPTLVLGSLLLCAVRVLADVDGNIGVIGFTPVIRYQSSGTSPADMSKFLLGPYGFYVADKIIKKDKLLPEVPSSEAATSGDDSVRLIFELSGTPGAPYMLIAVPAGVFVDGPEDLSIALAVATSRFDSHGDSTLAFQADVPLKDLALGQFVLLMKAPKERPEDD